VFTAADRDRLRERVIQLATSDSRVSAGAIVGSLANDDGDRWSDLDLTFGVVDGVPIRSVLEDWTSQLDREFGTVPLFDLPFAATLYRVFLLPGCLQFDLSFTPAAEFAALGPKFKLLFGRATDKPQVGPPAPEELFGYAVHHLVRARFCIERGRCWQAEYWISAGRDYALALACRRRGLPAAHGRGYDDLAPEVRDRFRTALVTSLQPAELLRALTATVEQLLKESGDIGELAVRLEPRLRMLTSEWGSAALA
jgi:hypothetical protein